jgi:NADH:ubiquinone oxidoreductase subunit K
MNSELIGRVHSTFKNMSDRNLISLLLVRGILIWGFGIGFLGVDTFAQTLKIKSYPVLSVVGLALAAKENSIVVGKILPGSPAEKSRALQEGDVLVACEYSGQTISFSGKSLGEVASVIRGPVGSSITLSICLFFKICG